jgi:hypothetical protein
MLQCHRRTLAARTILRWLVALAWACTAVEKRGADMTDHAKNLLIVVAVAGYASFVVADWYGYIKEPYATLIEPTVNLPAAVVRAGFLLYKT